MKNSTYDIIVCGGGAGGLSFVSEWLRQAPADFRVLLLEATPKNENDRTWCYWGSEPLPYPASHVKDWSNIRISCGKQSATKKATKFRYFEIDSLQFYQEVHQKLAQQPWFERRLATVTAIHSSIQLCQVETTAGTFKAKYVVNSIPDMVQQLPEHYALTQNFRGLRIRVADPVFDPDTVELMDFFPVNDDAAASFFYVLPYSKTEALIEYTRLSGDVWAEPDYDPYIGSYLSNKYGVTNFEVISDEFGVIPMTDFPYSRKPHPRIFQIGTIGGDTKPTTGYTFHFIQRHARTIVQEIVRAQSAEKPRLRFKFYDKLLLSIMLKHPDQVGEIMFQLFKNLPLSLVFKFLDERTNLLEDILIFSVLPKRIFLKALFEPKPSFYERNPAVPLDTALRRAK